RSSISENKQMLAHGPSGSVWNVNSGGGGVAANEHTAASFEHTSIILNTTQGWGGGVYVRTPIGAVATTVLDMDFVTLYSNASASTLGAATGNVDLECTSGTCSLANSIVWGVCKFGVVTAAGSGNFEDSAKGAPTCGFGLFAPIGTVIVGKAGGNDTMVVELTTGSPPVNAAIGTSCPLFPDFFDQRQLPRAGSVPCDMGAFEL
ncbi:MAG: choice-of-anchor Q domain-containing protein, partial [Myxococcota bacterium]